VRIISWIVGVYGLLWMIGLMATMRVHPHLVGDEGVRIRKSIAVDLTVPWTDIRDIRSRGRSLPPGGATQFEDGVLSYGVTRRTSEIGVRDLEQTHVVLGFEGRSFHAPEYYAVQVFANVLGGGSSSRIATTAA